MRIEKGDAAGDAAVPMAHAAVQMKQWRPGHLRSCRARSGPRRWGGTKMSV